MITWTTRDFLLSAKSETASKMAPRISSVTRNQVGRMSAPGFQSFIDPVQTIRGAGLLTILGLSAFVQWKACVWLIGACFLA